MDDRMSNQARSQSLRILIKRRDFLLKRIAERGAAKVTFDVSERDALDYAIRLIVKNMADEQRSQEESK